MEALKAGTPAPEFSLPSTPDQRVALSEFHGRPVVLIYYPADWSPVCGDELALFNELRDEFAKFDASVIGISVDGPGAISPRQRPGYRMTLLSDLPWEKSRASMGSTELRKELLKAICCQFRWTHPLIMSPIGVNPGLMRFCALESLSEANHEPPDYPRRSG
jgi:peroxiredoxin